MPDSENSKQVTNDLHNAQLGGGFINAENVHAGRIGGDIYNIYIGQPSQQTSDTEIDPVVLQLAKVDYLKQLKTIFEDVIFAGIDIGNSDINQPKKLANIFVTPYLEEDVLDNQEKTRQRFLANELFKNKQNKRILLLGKPGAGKTALISYFILNLCEQQLNSESIPSNKIGKIGSNKHKVISKNLGLSDEVDWLPIVLKIRELVFYPDISILNFAKNYAENRLNVTLPNKFFEHWLEKGHTIIFFDGLDEVEETQQPKVVERIKVFLSKYPQNRTIITSRLVYNPKRYFQAGEFAQYSIKDFHNGQIIIFINRWYNNYYLNKLEVKRYKANLIKSILNNERIHILAKNPLLLTIILLIHREQTQLPKKRSDLYNYAVKTLLNLWDSYKELETIKVLQYLKPDDLRWMMARLAYYIHAESTLDNQQGKMLIKRDRLIEQLSRYIQDEKQIKDHKAKAEAERFLERIVRDRAGLIILQGDDCYSFVHKTFQEYLAAEDISNRLEEHQNLTCLLDEIYPYLCDPHWYEVILLLVSRLNASQAAKLIKSILERNSDYEKWLHRNLLFAGRCLAENPEQFQKTEENLNLSTEILTRLFKLEASDDLCVGQKIKQQITEIFLNLSGTNFAFQLIEILKKYNLKIYSNHLLLYQMVLGEHEKVIDNIILLLKNKNSFKQTIKIIEKVNQYGKISDFLIQKFRLAFHGEIGIAKALNELGYSDHDVNEILSIDGYEQYYDNEAYEKFIQRQLEEANNIINLQINPLLHNLESDFNTSIDELIDWLYCEDSIITTYVSQEIGKLSSIYEEVEIKLLQRLENTDEEQINVVEALGELKNPSDKVIMTLVLLLHQNKNIYVRINAGKALTQLENNHDFVIEQLLISLKSDFQHSHFYSEILEIIVELGKKFNGVAPALANWIEQNQDKDYAVQGIDALWTLIEGSTASQL